MRFSLNLFRLLLSSSLSLIILTISLLPAFIVGESFENWLSSQESSALTKIFNNIAPYGPNLQDALPGVSVASPSRDHPDYYYQWTRDSAITALALVHTYASSPNSTQGFHLVEILDAYSDLQAHLQQVTNPSGSFSGLQGLAEPKFHVNGTAFTGPWGRPQRDGPALRALALIEYIRVYNATHPALWTSTDPPGRTAWYRHFYEATMPAESVIKADLEHISKYWNLGDGFDLWEEKRGIHLFTLMVQSKALREGADLALRFGDGGASEWYAAQYQSIQEALPRFYDRRAETLTSWTGEGLDVGGLDCGNLLGALHGHAPPSIPETGVQTPQDFYPPWSSEILNHLLAFVQNQRDTYPINADRPGINSTACLLSPVAIGRYPGDIYDGDGFSGGNPWFLCTASAAEVLYRTATHFAPRSGLPLDQPFWQELLRCAGGLEAIDREEGLWKALLEEVIRRADGFLAVMKRYQGPEGEMSEQINGTSGKQIGARDLTWSYGSLVEALRWRRRAVEAVKRIGEGFGGEEGEGWNKEEL